MAFRTADLYNDRLLAGLSSPEIFSRKPGISMRSCVVQWKAALAVLAASAALVLGACAEKPPGAPEVDNAKVQAEVEAVAKGAGRSGSCHARTGRARHRHRCL